MHPDMRAWLELNLGGRYGNFVDGHWQAPGPQLTAIFNPALKDQELARFSASSAADVDHAVRAAASAFGHWRRVPGPERGAILFRAAALIEQRADEFAFTISAEQGKVLAESRGEVARAIRELRFCAGEASRMDGATLPSEKPGGLALTLREPVGVVAAIAPWNFPLLTPLRKLAPALAYGCTLVLKPASLTPWSSAKLMDLLTEAGVPAGVINLITGSGDAGQALVAHPFVRAVSFTGSTQVGAEVNVRAASRFARTQLEMGGKNPAVVLGYAEVGPVAQQIVAAAFACSGQRCTAVSRIIVLERLADELGEALCREIAAIRVGPAWDTEATMGPLITGQHRASVLRRVAAALEAGARLRSGGDTLDRDEYGRGHFMQPTLLDRVAPGSPIAREEVFGPVLAMISVPSIEAAFEAANAVDYGLAACIYTADLDQALRFVRESQSGMVHVNHGTTSEAHVPFGGVKCSGAGPYSIGHSNLEFYTEMKAVYLQT
jgi:aldehyde dehydrogenase (NAD+)